MEITIEKVIERIEDWKKKQIKYEPLKGGITNHNYKVTVNGETFVVRIPGAETELFIDRDNELARNNDIIKRIMISIKTIHDRARFKKRFDPFDTIKNYMDNYIEKYNAPLPDDIDWMLSLCSDIEKAMQRNKPPDVACHNDYLSENFMDDGVKIWIIDWEYGGCGDPFFDLGDFAVEHPFSREQEEMIIKEYCGELNYEKLYRMLLHKIIADLWWSLWAMIQSRVSKIDFDFYTYGNKRFERLRKNAMDKDFQKWLDGI